MRFFRRSRWKNLLHDSDLALVAAFLNHQFANSVIPTRLAALIGAFVDDPTTKNAEAILEFDSEFAVHFENAKPGGLLTRLSKDLHEHDRLRPH